MKNKTIPKNFDFISYSFLKCADVARLAKICT